jgi:single-strand DNA-binding protein
VKDIVNHPKRRRDMNSIQLIGNLGNDPEVQESKGTTYCHLRLAVSERWTDGEGNRQERTDWFTVVAFNGLARVVGEHLAKGDRIAVAGKLKSSTYTRDGETRTSVEVHAVNIDFLRTKGSEQE